MPQVFLNSFRFTCFVFKTPLIQEYLHLFFPIILGVHIQNYLFPK